MGLFDEKTIPATLDYFKGQPFANVISFMQLVFLAGMMWAGLTIILPGERQAILEATAAQRAAFLDTMYHVHNTHTDQLNRQSDSFEKALDRYGSVR